jgi:hypothetical protein
VLIFDLRNGFFRGLCRTAVVHGGGEAVGRPPCDGTVIALCGRV